MKNKNLIKDILTYLKDNEEARERFNKQCLNTVSLESISAFEYYDIWLDEKNNDTDLEERVLFLITALSSPNGKPICGFLEKEGFENVKVVVHTGLKLIEKDIKDKKIINHAKTLRTIYLDALDEGKSHNYALKLINKEYNKICQKKK